MRKFYLTLLILLLVSALGYFWARAKIVGRAGESSVVQEISIKEGEGVNVVATKLQSSGIISHRIWFELYIWSKDRENKIAAGTYELRPNMTIPEVVDTLTTGKAKSEDEFITVIEGWNNREIGEYLSEKGIVGKEDFLAETKAVEKYKSHFSFLQDLPKNRDLEGYLFPDTYGVIKGKTTAAQLVYKMLLNFDQKMVDSMKEDTKKSGHSLDDIIKMASVIELEVPQEKERKIVSGIFWNRIEGKMPLESCATISYITGVKKKQYSFDDTRVDSPYNTYLNRGLPFGPIGNPGLSAIKAALYPQETDFVYFLSDVETGETFFAKTLDEHVRNKNEHGL